MQNAQKRIDLCVFGYVCCLCITQWIAQQWLQRRPQAASIMGDGKEANIAKTRANHKANLGNNILAVYEVTFICALELFN